MITKASVAKRYGVPISQTSRLDVVTATAPGIEGGIHFLPGPDQSPSQDGDACALPNLPDNVRNDTGQNLDVIRAEGFQQSIAGLQRVGIQQKDPLNGRQRSFLRQLDHLGSGGNQAGRFDLLTQELRSMLVVSQPLDQIDVKQYLFSVFFGQGHEGLELRHMAVQQDDILIGGSHHAFKIFDTSRSR